MKKNSMLVLLLAVCAGCGSGSSDRFRTDKTVAGTYSNYSAEQNGHYAISLLTPEEPGRPAGRIGFEVSNEPTLPYSQPFYLVTTIDTQTGQIIQRYLQSDGAPLMIAD